MQKDVPCKKLHLQRNVWTWPLSLFMDLFFQCDPNVWRCCCDRWLKLLGGACLFWVLPDGCYGITSDHWSASPLYPLIFLPCVTSSRQQAFLAGHTQQWVLRWLTAVVRHTHTRVHLLPPLLQCYISSSTKLQTIGWYDLSNYNKETHTFIHLLYKSAILYSSFARWRRDLQLRLLFKR